MNNTYPTSSPLVSVIIPAYNAERFIERTLQSVLAQTYQNIEVIVVDDGSHDHTATIVQSIAQQEHRVHFFQQANAGVASARNFAIQKSRGELIAPIDSDDIWYPQNLERQVHRIIEDTSLGLVYSWSIEINEDDQMSGGFHASDFQGEIYVALLNQNFIGNASAVLIRRRCLEEVGGYNCTLRAQNAQGGEDLDLYLRIAEHYRVGVVPEFLVGYRQVANSMSRNCDSMAKSQALVLEAAQQRCPEIPSSIYRWSTSRFSLYLAHQSYRSENTQQTLHWLHRAFKLDPAMSLLRYDLYLLLFKIYLNKNSLKIHLLQNSSNAAPNRTQRTTITEIKRMVKVRRFLPFTLFEQARLKLAKFKSKQNTRRLARTRDATAYIPQATIGNSKH